MSNPNPKKNEATAGLLEERDALLEEMSTLSQLLHGSWVERYMVCSRADCKCHRGERHGPRHFLVVNEQGRQRQKYVASRHEPAVRAGLAQHRRLAQIVDRITQLNLALMKVDAYER
jgi:hypothetical protein